MTIYGLVCALGAIAIYAGMFAVGRHGALHGLDGFDQTAIRFAVSGAVVLLFARAWAMPATARLGGPRLLVLFCLGGAPYSAVFLGGLAFAPVAVGAALVPGLQPLAVLGISAAWLAQRPTSPQLIGASICFAGLLIVLLDPRSTHGPDATSVLTGIGLFVCAALLWGGYAVVLKRWAVDPREALATIAPLSAMIYLPVYLIWRGTLPIAEAPVFAIALQAAYQGLLVGIVAVVLYAAAVNAIGSTSVALLAPAMPVMAALIGLFGLGESPTPIQWAGLGVVTAGLVLGSALPMFASLGRRAR